MGRILIKNNIFRQTKIKSFLTSRLALKKKKPNGVFQAGTKSEILEVVKSNDNVNMWINLNYMTLLGSNDYMSWGIKIKNMIWQQSHRIPEMENRSKVSWGFVLSRKRVKVTDNIRLWNFKNHDVIFSITSERGITKCVTVILVEEEYRMLKFVL